MPQKTKKQKLIAQYRRKLQFYQDRSANLNPQAPLQEEPIRPKPSLFSYPSSAPKQPAGNQEKTVVIDEKEFTAIKHDLRYTMVVIIALLGLEIALWRIIGS